MKLLKFSIAIVLCFVICALNGYAQTSGAQLNRDPNKVKFVTSDIDNFWRAYDLASKEAEHDKRVAIFQSEYLDQGSAGLQDFVRLRIKSAKNLTEAVEKLPRFFASIRASTLRVKEMEKEMRRSFRHFQKLYAGAAFPDVYFVIGVLSTGGTTSDNGLLIGTELYGLTRQTPRDEIASFLKSTYLSEEKDEKKAQAVINSMLDTALKPIENVPPTVAHESVHFNQNYPKPDPVTLLDQSIKEGAADFLGEKICGQLMNPSRNVYGNAHEAELWQGFQVEMNGTYMKNWLYNGLTARDKPMDLGYFMGYKICEQYYRKAKDKRQAIRDILEIKDFQAFVERSGYRRKFGTAKSAA